MMQKLGSSVVMHQHIDIGHSIISHVFGGCIDVSVCISPHLLLW